MGIKSGQLPSVFQLSYLLQCYSFDIHKYVGLSLVLSCLVVYTAVNTTASHQGGLQ